MTPGEETGTNNHGEPTNSRIPQHRHPGVGAGTNSRGVKRPTGRATRGSGTPSPPPRAMSEAASEHASAERCPSDSPKGHHNTPVTTTVRLWLREKNDPNYI